MDKGKVLRIDFQVQVASIAALIVLCMLSWLGGQWLSYGIILLLLLVIWQFFSGIYIAAEFKMLHRGVPPGALLVLVTLCILFAAAEFTSGLLIGACLFPIILLSNVILAASDWYSWYSSQKINTWHPHRETILDTEDIFR